MGEARSLLELTCSCGAILNPDSKFNEDARRSGVLKRMLRCLNGHTLIVESIAQLVEQELNVNTNDEFQPRVVDRNRSVLCDVCRRRIYNAHANQKRHQGYCQQQHQLKKYKEDKKLHDLIGPEGKKVLKGKHNVPK